MAKLDDLLGLMARLRDPDGGCPWDLEQTFASIAPYTIEEAYEVDDAIRRGDLADLREELGDLLLQVVFHARMASEAGHFDFGDVVDTLCAKLVRRHPHVFGDTVARDSAEVLRAWEEHKSAERSARGASSLDSVPRALPALAQAAKLARRAARAEPESAPTPAPAPELASSEALGDALFDLAARAAQAGLDPETALRDACHRYRLTTLA